MRARCRHLVVALTLLLLAIPSRGLVPYIGELEPLRIQGHDESYAGRSAVPTFALRQANRTAFLASPPAGQMNRQRRGIEGCLQPASHGPAFILDHVLSPSTCQALMNLLDDSSSSSGSSSFAQFSAGKNHHGALQLLVPLGVANAVAQTLVPHIDMQMVEERRQEMNQQSTNDHPSDDSMSEQSSSSSLPPLTCVGLNRRWRIYKYAPGGQERFAPHIDAGFPPSGEAAHDGVSELVYDDSCGQNIVSRLTVLIYLNHDFVGGETNFFTPVKGMSEPQQKIASVRPVQGSCLVFPQGVGERAVEYAREHWPLHEGSPVLSGNHKYVIRSDVLFLEETTVNTNVDEEQRRLFQYDDNVRSVFRPQFHSSVVDPAFLSHVDSLYNPHMGAENLGPLLYSLIRFTKKKIIVEVGAGYTSLFLLKALADNDKEMKRIHELQQQGECRLLDWPWANEAMVQNHVEGESSSLLCIDNCLHQKETATGASAVARGLGFDAYLEFIKADAFDVELPTRSIDVIWLDFGVGSRIKKFVQNLWGSLRPGGLLLCHSTLTNERTRNWLEAARRRGPESITGIPPEEYVEVSLLEPHKHYQNSISIFQKRANYTEPLYSVYA